MTSPYTTRLPWTAVTRVLTIACAILLNACGGSTADPLTPGAPHDVAAASVNPDGDLIWSGDALTEVGYAADPPTAPGAPGASLARPPVIATHTSSAPSYAVINLAPGYYGGDPDINNKNQVAMSVENAAGFRSYFFNGQTVRDIGTLGGPYTFAAALNDAGQLTGSSSYSSAEFVHAFLWSAATGMRDLGTIGGPSSFGLDINKSGLVAGNSTVTAGPAFTRHAFRWSPSEGMRDLGVLPGSSTSTALAINDSGTVVGYGESGAFVWTPATGMVNIGRDALATLVNNQGQVAGVSNFSQTTGQRAFVWTRSTGMVDIGTLGGSQSDPAAMNEHGQVVGSSFTGSPAGGAIHAMSWTRANGMRDLGTLGGDFSTAEAVNDHGVVVGQSSYRSDTDQEHAFVWSPAWGMMDLNLRIPRAPAGLELYGALAISNPGAIVANSNAGLVLLQPGSTGTDAPVVSPITGGAEPLTAGKAVTFAANFADQNATDRHRATWYWGGGCHSGPGTITEANGMGRVTGTYTWCRAGTYWITLTVTDSTGRRSTVARRVEVAAAAKHAVGS